MNALKTTIATVIIAAVTIATPVMAATTTPVNQANVAQLSGQYSSAAKTQQFGIGRDNH